VNISEALGERVAAALHAKMPGCTHDGHGSDCKALANAVIAEVGHLRLTQYQTCTTCGAGYKVDASCATCAFHAQMAAEAPVPPPIQERPIGDDERVTGHLVTCLAVAEGEADPDCPCKAEHAWIYRVTALPEDREPESQYYTSASQARFWRDQVGSIGYRIMVGRVPAEAFEALPEEVLDRLADEERNAS
jgi:hypothetical protein